jgi:hypothetical protein
LKDLGVDGRILKEIFKKWDRNSWTVSGYGQVDGACECGNEPLCSTKCEEILD